MYLLEKLSEFLVNYLFLYIDIITNINIMEHLQSTKLQILSKWFRNSCTIFCKITHGRLVLSHTFKLAYKKMPYLHSHQKYFVWGEASLNTTQWLTRAHWKSLDHLFN